MSSSIAKPETSALRAELLSLPFTKLGKFLSAPFQAVGWLMKKVGIVDWDRVFETATSGPIQPAQEAATQLLDAGLSGVSTVADRESGPASGDAARKPRPTRRPRRASSNCGAVRPACVSRWPVAIRSCWPGDG